MNAAKAGSLTFMVGGKESEYEAVKEVLLCMGENVLHCGPVGTGQAAKICNNMALAVSMIGVSEAMNLGIRFVKFSLQTFVHFVFYYMLKFYKKMVIFSTINCNTLT